MSMSNFELGKYLRTVRESLGYSTYDVNKLCDISPSYLSLMETGKRKPSAVILKKIAPIYNLNYLDLYEKAGYVDLIDTEVKTDELGNPVSDIPLLGTVKAGYDYLAQENWIRTIKVETSLVGNGSEYFALEVKGDSMAPSFLEGDIVIIHKQNDCENNQIAIVIVNGEEGTIKKVRKTEQGIILQPLNPAYAPMVFSNAEIKSIPILIVGIVKQLKREF